MTCSYKLLLKEKQKLLKAKSVIYQFICCDVSGLIMEIIY